MKLRIITVLMLSCLGLQSIEASERIKPSVFKANQFIVKLKEGVKSSSLNSNYTKSIRKLYKNVYLVNTINSMKFKLTIQKKKIAKYIERNRIAKHVKLPMPEAIDFNDKMNFLSPYNDPKSGHQWLLKDASKNGISQMISARNTRSGFHKEVIVAVVDTGIDYNHEDLKDVMWTNTKEIAGNGIDDDDNGYIDDIHGISTLKRDAKGRATGDIYPVHPHGTHVAGIIGAKQNNNIGIAGVSSHVRIMGIQTVPGNGDEIDSDVIESFIYAAKNGAKIINCSFGKSKVGTEKAVSDAIDYIAKEYGVLVVAAAGNDSNNIDKEINYVYPANLLNDSLLVVASTTSWGWKSYFSNYGLVNVDLAAPGSSIYSTIPGNGYASMSGTSMAAPVVSGVAAEVLSINPDFSPVELKQRLMDTVSSRPEWSSKMVSAGIVNLNKALNN